MRLGSSRPLAFLLGTAVVAVCPALRPVLADEPGDRIDRIFAAYDKPDSPGCAVAVLHRGKVIHRRGYGRAHLEWDAADHPVDGVPRRLRVQAVHGPGRRPAGRAGQAVARRRRPQVPAGAPRLRPRRHPAAPAPAHQRPARRVVPGRFRRLAAGRPGDRPRRARPGRPPEGGQLPARASATLYGNTGYILAGLVVRRVSGRSLRAFTDAHVFKPLGMTNTHFHDDHREVVKGRASAYALRSGRPRSPSPRSTLVGSTGLFTTVDDLARWDQNFNDRRVGGKRPSTRCSRRAG